MKINKMDAVNAFRIAIAILDGYIIGGFFKTPLITGRHSITIGTNLGSKEEEWNYFNISGEIRDDYNIVRLLLDKAEIPKYQ